MIVSAFTTDDPRVALSYAVPENERSELNGVFCMADVNVTSAFIDFHDRQDYDRPCRPYMHMIGECIALHGELPYEVNALQFPEGRGLPVDIFYEFDDEQLAKLVMKGLYKPNFQCPDILYGSTIMMPVHCDMMLIPAGKDLPPIVFANIQSRGDIEVKVEDCGYDFEPFFEEAVAEVDEQVFDDSVDMHDDYGFHYDEELAVDNPEREGLNLEDIKTQMLRLDYEDIYDRVISDHVEPQKKIIEDAISRAASGVEEEVDTDVIEFESFDEPVIEDDFEFDDEISVDDYLDDDSDDDEDEYEFFEFNDVDESDDKEESEDNKSAKDKQRMARQIAIEDNTEANAETFDVNGDGVVDDTDKEIEKSEADKTAQEAHVDRAKGSDGFENIVQADKEMSEDISENYGE